jgi:hypothetical protein
MSMYHAQLKQYMYKVCYGHIAWEDDLWETRTKSGNITTIGYEETIKIKM